MSRTLIFIFNGCGKSDTTSSGGLFSNVLSTALIPPYFSTALLRSLRTAWFKSDFDGMGSLSGHPLSAPKSCFKLPKSSQYSQRCLLLFFNFHPNLSLTYTLSIHHERIEPSPNGSLALHHSCLPSKTSHFYGLSSR